MLLIAKYLAKKMNQRTVPLILLIINDLFPVLDINAFGRFVTEATPLEVVNQRIRNTLECFLYSCRLFHPIQKIDVSTFIFTRNDFDRIAE